MCRASLGKYFTLMESFGVLSRGGGVPGVVKLFSTG